MVIVAMFLNLLHQMGGVFISLYGLAVGMSLTQIGIIRAAYAGCNAVTRPISGHVVNKLGHKGLSYFGLPLQSLDSRCWCRCSAALGRFYSFMSRSGFMRAIVIVANAVGLVQDVPESRVRRGLASGVYNAAGDLGNILGSVDRRLHRARHRNRQRVRRRLVGIDGAVFYRCIPGAAVEGNSGVAESSVLSLNGEAETETETAGSNVNMTSAFPEHAGRDRPAPNCC